MVPKRELVATMILSLFMSTIPGEDGVGSEEISISKAVLADRLMPVIWSPILRFTTSEDEQVSSVAPCTIDTVRLRSLKLSNYSGNVRQIQLFAGTATLQTALIMKNVDCSTSMLELSIPVTVTEPYPAQFSGFITVSTRNSSLYSMKESEELFQEMPMKMLSVTYSAYPFKYLALGQVMPQTDSTQVSPTSIMRGLLETRIWQGVLGSTAQSMKELSILQQTRYSSFQICWEQQRGKLMIHWVSSVTGEYWLTMEKDSCCSSPSVLKNGLMMMNELTLSEREGNCCVDSSLLQTVYERSYLRTQIMPTRSCSMVEGVLRPYILMVQLAAVRQSCSPSNRIWQYFRLRVQTAGICTPAESSSCTLSLEETVFRLLRSLLMTIASDSSSLSWRGRSNSMVKELQTIGLFLEQDTSVMQIGRKSATEVSRMRVPFSMTQLSVGSRSSACTQWMMVLSRIETPQISMKQVWSLGSLSWLRMEMVSSFLSVLDSQVTSMGVEGLCTIEHMLVEICIPVKYSRNTDPISTLLLGVNPTVQKVFSTPSDTTLHVKVSVLRQDAQNTPLSWLISSFTQSIVPVSSVRQRLQQGRS